MRYALYIVLAFISASLLSCSSMKPYHTEPVRAEVDSKVDESLNELPQPSDKIVAAVYRFRDQTGAISAVAAVYQLFNSRNAGRYFHLN